LARVAAPLPLYDFASNGRRAGLPTQHTGHLCEFERLARPTSKSIPCENLNDFAHRGSVCSKVFRASDDCELVLIRNEHAIARAVTKWHRSRDASARLALLNCSYCQLSCGSKPASAPVCLAVAVVAKRNRLNATQRARHNVMIV